MAAPLVASVNTLSIVVTAVRMMLFHTVLQGNRNFGGPGFDQLQSVPIIMNITVH